MMAAAAPNVAARHAGGTELGQADSDGRAQDDGEGGDPPAPQPGDQVPAGGDGHGQEQGQAGGGHDGTGPLLPAQLLAEPEGQDGHQERELQGQDGLDDRQAPDMEGEGLEEESGDETHAAEQPHLAAHGIGDQAEVQRVLGRGILHAHALEDGGEGIGQRSRRWRARRPCRHLPVVGRPHLWLGCETPISGPVFRGPPPVAPGWRSAPARHARGSGSSSHSGPPRLKRRPGPGSRRRPVPSLMAGESLHPARAAGRRPGRVGQGDGQLVDLTEVGEPENTRELANSMLGALLAVVHRVAGDEGVTQVLAQAGERRSAADLERPDGWSSYPQGLALFRAAAEVLGDPDIGRKAGTGGVPPLRRYRGPGPPAVHRIAGRDDPRLSRPSRPSSRPSPTPRSSRSANPTV